MYLCSPVVTGAGRQQRFCVALPVPPCFCATVLKGIDPNLLCWSSSAGGNYLEPFYLVEVRYAPRQCRIPGPGKQQSWLHICWFHSMKLSPVPIITCSPSELARYEKVPVDSSQIFYKYAQWGFLAKPSAGDCAGYCNYSFVKCSPPHKDGYAIKLLL